MYAACIIIIIKSSKFFLSYN